MGQAQNKGADVSSREQHLNQGQSRECILNSISELLLVKSYDCITVRDVVEKAKVSRSTFYRHFLSVDDAIAEIEDRFINTMRDINRLGSMNKASQSSTHLSATQLMRFEALRDNRIAALALLSSNSNPRFKKKETDLIRQYFTKKLAMTNLSNEEEQLYLSYFIEGNNGFIMRWLRDFPDIEISKVAALMNRLIYAPLFVND